VIAAVVRVVAEVALRLEDQIVIATAASGRQRRRVVTGCGCAVCEQVVVDPADEHGCPTSSHGIGGVPLEVPGFGERAFDGSPVAALGTEADVAVFGDELGAVPAAQPQQCDVPSEAGLQRDPLKKLGHGAQSVVGPAVPE
jgi:hypothetical protein